MPTLRISAGLLILVAAANLGFAADAVAGPTESEREPDREALLALPWKEFDQTQNSGWRWYITPTRKRYLEAARLIEDYLERHHDLTPRQRALCHFHAAYAYLFRPLRTGVGSQLEAIPHLDRAFVPEGATAPSADWNELVRAVKAFLVKDRATLLLVKARVAAMPPESVKFLNPPASPEDFLAHLGEPYGSWFPQPKPKE